MPTYAVLGATGNIVLNLLRALGKRQDTDGEHSLHVNAYVASSEQISIHVGALEDLDLLTTCLKDADAIFLAVAVSDNVPACQVAQSTARLVVKALESLRSSGKDVFHPPLLLVLSSSSISTRLWRGEGMPQIVHSMLMKAASHVYHDLSVAESFLRNYKGNNQRELYSVTFVKPGGLVHDAQKGHVIHKEASKTFTSFADCAAGTMEIASSRDKEHWDGEEVSVNSVAPKGAEVSFVEGLGLLRALLKGLLYHFIPWSYRWF